MNKLICKKCGEQMFSNGSGESTYVGYISPKGHNHDDNCRTRWYRCNNGHAQSVSKINRCSTPGCNWVGKTYCNTGSCGGQKVDEWYE